MSDFKFTGHQRVLPTHWQSVADTLRADESILAQQTLQMIHQSDTMRDQITAQASHWVEAIRQTREKMSGMSVFFTQLDLSSEESIGLMCLAEVLLRIPDAATVDAMLSEQLAAGAGVAKQQRQGWFAHAAHWGMVLGAQVMVSDSEHQWLKSIQGLVKRLGAPVVRTTVLKVMAQLGEHFVMGETIQRAIKRSEKTSHAYTYSYDMLGEAAVTFDDAESYFLAYESAIEALAAPNKGDIWHRPGVSIKLSALHPRYEWAQRDRCLPVLIARVSQLVRLAKRCHVSITLDAEEADRLILSLEVFASVLALPEIQQWSGFGLAVQAYQKSALAVIDGCVALAKQYETCIPIRLVKGAYWDSEIKAAQVAGLPFAVWTRKALTDMNYLACAQRLFAAKTYVYPQFATHNAQTVAAIMAYADGQAYEFQCLHGMGQVLYDHVLSNVSVPCRIYAPVGAHQTLLPYLVRRLLENGANSSFVHQLVSPSVSVDTLVQCPIAIVKQLSSIPHPKIRSAEALFDDRRNALGYDLNNAWHLEALVCAMNDASDRAVHAIATGAALEKAQTIMGPITRHKPVGSLLTATPDVVAQALQSASEGYRQWSQWPVNKRSACLLKAADLLEKDRQFFYSLCIREAGKTWQDAIDEVREAIDFLRYYAVQAQQCLQPQLCPGPTGEENIWRPVGRGVFLCLSPWNFPLAIFVGQVSAALVAGNAVLAKPASQTAAIAFAMMQRLYQAGVPTTVCQFLPGGHRVVGSPLVSDNRVHGVMLTGSTKTAKIIAKNLADRSGPIVPFIAETGGQNVMIVDSTALLEQAALDLIASAFKSAGQRCSACRVVYVQTDVADALIRLLCGAMATLVVGDPCQLATDIGPVIDAQALAVLQAHEASLKAMGAVELASCILPDDLPEGPFFAPKLFEIQALSQLKEEVFGPILHLIRYEKESLDQVKAAIHATGYGLTMGIQSRMVSVAKQLAQEMDVGNVYINRNMVGAVVGVQPFGGDHLSGTGPKAGGPWYLQRLCKEQVISTNTTAIGGNASLMTLSESDT